MKNSLPGWPSHKIHLDYLFLFFLSFPLGLSFLFAPTENYFVQAASVCMLEAFCICSYCLIKRKTISLPVASDWISAILCFWLVWTIFAAMKSTSQPHSVIRQLEWFVHILFGLCIFTFLRSRLYLTKYLNLIVIVGFFILTVFLVGHWHLSSGSYNFDWVHPPYFVHVRQLTHLAVAVLLLIPVRKKYLWLTLPLLSIAWGVLLWTGGRAGILSVCFGLFVIALLGKQWAILVPHGVAALIGLELSFLFPINDMSVVGIHNAVERTVNGKTMDKVFTGRFSIWETGLKSLKSSPFIGLGPDGFKDLYSIHKWRGSNAHGSWLQFFMEWGIPGGLAFIIIQLRMLWEIWKKRAPIFESDHAAGCFGLLCAYLLLSLVSGVFYYAVSLMLVSYSLAVLFAHIFPEKSV